MPNTHTHKKNIASLCTPKSLTARYLTSSVLGWVGKVTFAVIKELRSEKLRFDELITQIFMIIKYYIPLPLSMSLFSNLTIIISSRIGKNIITF